MMGPLIAFFVFLFAMSVAFGLLVYLGPKLFEPVLPRAPTRGEIEKAVRDRHAEIGKRVARQIAGVP